MCLIIASQDGTLPNEELLRVAHYDNSHGWGVMWPEKGAVRSVKGFRYETMLKAITRLEGTPFAVHMRWATHGNIDQANCHPFRVNRDLFIMHNGVLNIATPNKSYSDTWHFAQELKGVYAEYPALRDRKYDALLMKYVEARCETRNKVVMMHASGEMLIANRKAGMDYEGLWLSNGNSLPGQRAYSQFYNENRWATKLSIVQHTNIFDGEAVSTTKPQECDFCTCVALTRYGWEGQMLCKDCLDWVRREDKLCKDLYGETELAEAEYAYQESMAARYADIMAEDQPIEGWSN